MVVCRSGCVKWKGCTEGRGSEMEEDNGHQPPSPCGPCHQSTKTSKQKYFYLQKIMQKHAGVFRNEKSLKIGVEKMNDLYSKTSSMPNLNP